MMPMKTKPRWLLIASLTIFLIGLTGCSCSIRTLPPDQVMIDHFKTYKKEFNELVKSYGARDGKSITWAARPEVIELKAKTGIDRIIDGPGYWFDDPYSLEAAQKLKEMDDAKAWQQNRSRKTALVKMANTNVYSAVYFLDGGDNWKDYVYIPVDPVIERGRIKWPREPMENNEFRLWLRVLDSLDSPKWGKGECVLRKIEPKWFLSRCRAN